MSETHSRSNLLTLSLPVPRRKWLVSRVLVVAGLVFALAFWVSLPTEAVGALAGLPVPAGGLVVAAVLNGFATAVWAWPGMLGTSFSRDSIRAGLLVVVLMTAAEVYGGATAFGEWRIMNLANLEVWQRGIPWRSFFTGLAVAGGATLLTLRRFERADC